MALKGTLKDFGIADILNLIGQQKKTGVLYIKSRNEEVEVSFLEGNVVRALSNTRRSKELLGEMLVRSELLSREQLDKALEIQKRTLKRLGDILVAEGWLTGEQLREMTELQTTETLFKLFNWKTGTYEFSQQDVEHDQARGPAIRPESVLMEGFRRIDEWPMVRKVVSSEEMTFERLRHLEPPPLRPSAGADELDAALDAALEAPKREEGVPRSIGRHERLVFKLATPGVTVRRLCDLSRLGDFETSKALFNLVQAGFLQTVAPGRAEPPEGSGERRSIVPPEVGKVLRSAATQAALGLLLVVLFAVAASALGQRPLGAAVEVPVRADAGRDAVVDNQLARLQAALEMYRLAHGRYPDKLRLLAETGVVPAVELSRPFSAEYHYRPVREGYVLLPPLE